MILEFICGFVSGAALVLSAVTFLLSTGRMVGGLTFFRLGRIGGSIYLSKE